MFTWQIALESKKSRGWYLGAITVALTLVVWGALMEMYMLSLAAIILSGVYLYTVASGTTLVEFSVDEGSIRIGSDEHLYSGLKGFIIKFSRGNPISLLIPRIEQGVGRDLEIDLPPGEDLSELLEYLETKIPHLGSREVGALEEAMNSYLKV